MVCVQIIDLCAFGLQKQKARKAYDFTWFMFATGSALIVFTLPVLCLDNRKIPATQETPSYSYSFTDSVGVCGHFFSALMWDRRFHMILALSHTFLHISEPTMLSLILFPITQQM